MDATINNDSYQEAHQAGKESERLGLKQREQVSDWQVLLEILLEYIVSLVLLCISTISSLLPYCYVQGVSFAQVQFDNQRTISYFPNSKWQGALSHLV